MLVTLPNDTTETRFWCVVDHQPVAVFTEKSQKWDQ